MRVVLSCYCCDIYVIVVLVLCNYGGNVLLPRYVCDIIVLLFDYCVMIVLGYIIMMIMCYSRVTRVFSYACYYVVIVVGL